MVHGLRVEAIMSWMNQLFPAHNSKPQTLNPKPKP